MSENKQIKVETTGPIWLIGWLFTIGFVKMSFWKAVFALLLWPYFLGQALADKIS
jgi:uncharacterized membrane protein